MCIAAVAAGESKRVVCQLRCFGSFSLVFG